MAWFPNLTDAPLKRVSTVFKQDKTKSNAEHNIEKEDKEASSDDTSDETNKKKNDSLLDVYV